MNEEQLKKKIVKLSRGDAFENVKNEWVEITEEHTPIKSTKCLCNFGLKHSTFYFNTITNENIILGGGCKKHMGLVQHISGKTGEENEEGQTTPPLNVKYNDYVIQKLLEIYTTRVNETPLFRANEMLDELHKLIFSFNMLFLMKIYNELTSKYHEYLLQKKEENQKKQKPKKEEVIEKEEVIDDNISEISCEDFEYEDEEEEDEQEKCNRCGAMFDEDEDGVMNIVLYEGVKRYKRIIDYEVCGRCETLIDNWKKRGYGDKSYEY